MQTIFVPIGDNCSVAYNLQKLGLRIFALPFDWIRIGHLSSVSSLIENKFSGFLDDLVEIDHSNKFKCFGDDYEYADGLTKICVVQNTKYNIKFYHDFNKEIVSEIDDIKEKYARRIERLFDHLISKNKIIFAFDSSHKLACDDINKFVNDISKLYPDLNFELRILTKKKILEDDKIDSKVKVTYDDKPYGNWTKPNVLWDKFFEL